MARTVANAHASSSRLRAPVDEDDEDNQGLGTIDDEEQRSKKPRRNGQRIVQDDEEDEQNGWTKDTYEERPVTKSDSSIRTVSQTATLYRYGNDSLSYEQ
jgi:hypothetical protein